MLASVEKASHSAAQSSHTQRLTHLSIFRCPVNKQGNSSHSLGAFGCSYFVTITKITWSFGANACSQIEAVS